MLEICADSWIFLSSVLFGTGVVIEPFSFFFSLNPGALPGSLWQCLGLLCLRCVQRVKLRDPLCCKRRLRYRRCSTALPLAALCGCRERPGHSARPPRRVPVSGRAQRGPGTCRRSARGARAAAALRLHRAAQPRLPLLPRCLCALPTPRRAAGKVRHSEVPRVSGAPPSSLRLLANSAPDL